MKKTLFFILAMAVASILGAIATVIFYEAKMAVVIGLYEDKREEFQKNFLAQKSAVEYFNSHYESNYKECLVRERHLSAQMWIVRKDHRKYYEVALRENQRRINAWLKGKKPAQRQSFLTRLKSMGTFAKSPTGSKSGSQTYSAAIGGDFMP